MHIILIIQLLSIPFLTQISNWAIEHVFIIPPFFGIGEKDLVWLIDPATLTAMAFTSA